MRTPESGFTLIELMIVVAIIGTLAALAMPAYQDYTIRAQIAEGLNLASGAKTAIEEFHSENGGWPKNNGAAGVADKHDIIGKYTEHVSIKDNTIEVKFEYDSHEAIQKKKIDLTATDNDGSISWECTGNGIPANRLPPACR